MEKYIEIHNTKIHIDCPGKGETILLLAGLGSFSPIIELKPLVDRLKETYKVITLEYAGYGQSEGHKSERTIENIAGEIHEVMMQLGEKRYSIIAHSVAGIYGLYYTNCFKDEVKCFVGIDISVPKQYTNELAQQEMEAMMKSREQNLENNSTEFITEIRRSAVNFLQSQTSYSYTKEELEYYADMAVKSMHESAVIEEIKHLSKNVERVAQLKFPEECKTLLLLSNENTKRIPEWEAWHQELVNISAVVEVVEGDHYLHLLKTETIAEKINLFIS